MNNASHDNQTVCQKKTSFVILIPYFWGEGGRGGSNNYFFAFQIGADLENKIPGQFTLFEKLYSFTIVCEKITRYQILIKQKRGVKLAVNQSNIYLKHFANQLGLQAVLQLGLYKKINSFTNMHISLVFSIVLDKHSKSL